MILPDRIESRERHFEKIEDYHVSGVEGVEINKIEIDQEIGEGFDLESIPLQLIGNTVIRRAKKSKKEDNNEIDKSLELNLDDVMASVMDMEQKGDLETLVQKTNNYNSFDQNDIFEKPEYHNDVKILHSIDRRNYLIESNFLVETDIRATFPTDTSDKHINSNFKIIIK